MEWFVKIRGERFDLEDLCKSVNSRELCIIQEGQDFILKSTDFNSLIDADEVRSKANEIIMLMNGAARLVKEMKKSLAVDCVVKVLDDGNRNFFIQPTEATSTRCSVNAPDVAIDGVVQQVHQKGPISSWITVARHDVSVAMVLRLYGSGEHDWVGLYRIYEVIENDIGGVIKIVKNGWATNESIKLFKRTANSPGAIGDKSRHGLGATEPPKHPMKLSEAKSLVETIIHKWIRLKGKN